MWQRLYKALCKVLTALIVWLIYAVTVFLVGVWVGTFVSVFFLRHYQFNDAYPLPQPA